MTDTPTRRGRLIFEGWAKPDDPIYQGGWNFIAGKNLNPRYVEKSIGRKPEQKQQPEKKKPED